ncbi:polymer-forming cytoskeletal protein [Patescibacteria group bacterium]|nr:polymer-forming cytoskeletal protein [Patescibacteria group bacterium]MBU1015511.1 polymer-forming cytoskeletal protein [Patescibacteria group bacterium]MBU1685434.1 polymer-forming cytoskeletal protein [Patescibacteria group bacterium]MBU1938395.1 polymer-forming cytoskeletal protein [Patescibacteria group bacterium]
MKKLVFTFLAALLFLPNLVQAATFVTGEKVYVDQQISDDLYVTGGILSVQETVNGDVLAGGGKINIDGGVSQDLMAGAGDLSVTGEIGDDVRVIGGSIRIDATIKGDLLGAGGDLTLTDESFVGGDVALGGGNIMAGGTINGDVKLAGGTVYFNSDVKGNVALFNFEKVIFGPGAKIHGDLWYRASQQIKIPEGVVVGNVIFSGIPSSQIEKNLPAFLAGFSLFSLLATLLFGLIMIWLCRYYVLHSADLAYEATLKSLGIGFLALILTPIVALVLLITTIGIPTAMVLMAFWLVALYAGKVTAAMLIGFRIVRIEGDSGFGRVFWSFALGTLIYTLIGMVPVVGWVVNLIFVLIALGSLTLYGFEVFGQLRKKKIA